MLLKLLIYFFETGDDLFHFAVSKTHRIDVDAGAVFGITDDAGIAGSENFPQLCRSCVTVFQGDESAGQWLTRLIRPGAFR